MIFTGMTNKGRKCNFLFFTQFDVRTEISVQQKSPNNFFKKWNKLHIHFNNSNH